MAAALLLSGHVLAAACLCVSKAPPAVPAATEAPCPQHGFDDTLPVPASQHCPADEPSAQARTSDLPTAQLLAAAAVTPFGSFAAPAPALPEFRAEPESPQRPIYARLHRLQL
jgi:hypothetical protein